jgi:SRSO17 transposase
MAFYVTFAPHTSELRDLAAVAGLHWTIEECFQSAKGETGLDHCEARSWHGWHRHMTMVILETASPSQCQACALPKTRREVEIQITATVVLD